MTKENIPGWKIDWGQAGWPTPPILIGDSSEPDCIEYRMGEKKLLIGRDILMDQHSNDKVNQMIAHNFGVSGEILNQCYALHRMANAEIKKDNDAENKND